MKIEGPGSIGNGTPGSSKSSEPVKGPSFDEVLNRATKQGAAQTSKAGAPAPLPESPLAQFSLASNDPFTFQTADRVYKALADLEMLGATLGVPDMPLERLGEYIDELDSGKDELAALIGKIPDGELKSIASETLALIIGQVNQYHSGYRQ